MTLTRRATGLALALGLGLVATPALAEEHVVEMLNQAPDGTRQAFRPLVVNAQPGDTVRFVATDRGHNSQSIAGPEAGAEWNGRINEEVVVELTTPGFYMYKCTPHFAQGMIGAIVVGDSTDGLEAAKAERYVGKARQVSEEIFAQVEQQGS